MRKNLTELVFILDRSGSMQGLEKDTIGGFNSTLINQKEEEGECIVTTVLFDNLYELLYDRIPIKGVEPISEKEYYVRGSTALHDAIGLTVAKIANVQKNTLEKERATKIIFVIITDGYENSSREYTGAQVRNLISAKKAEGWEFLFLGANIDATETAVNLGIDADRAADFVPDALGTQKLYSTINEGISRMRGQKPLEANWKKEIDEDYKKRGQKE